jgi:ribosomal protein S18 acetylase RimI-like enzyme
VAVSLRNFQRGDAETLLALCRRAQTREEEQVATPLWTTRAELDAELASLEPGAEQTLRVAEDAGTVAGFGGIELDDEPRLFGPIVAPAFRGRKVGRTLLAASIDLARAERVDRLVAGLGVRNIGGRIMLERNGFEPRGGPVAVYRLLPGQHKRVDVPSHPGITTHVALTAETDRVLPLCRECFARSALVDEAWRRAIDCGEVRVAEEEGTPVAVVRIHPSRRRVFHGVAPHARERGIGGFVLSEALEDYWAEHPGESLRLSAPVENVPAARIYRHQGFLPWLLMQPFELAL